MNYKEIRNRAPARVQGRSMDLVPAIRRQIGQVMNGGLPVALRKLRTFMRMVPDLPGALLAVPVVIIVRLLRPFVLIRFGAIRSPNFGHLVAESELYLSKRDVGLDETDSVDIFYYTSRPGTYPIANQQLKVMWDRTLRINRFARWPDWINRSVPGGTKHMVPPRNGRDPYGVLARTEPHLRFTEEEERRGQDALRAMGIPEGAQFVAFHARDSMWLQQLDPGRDYSYHNHRDSSIATYIPAVEKLTEKGYYAVRMGSVVKDVLETSNGMIIDYATNGSRSEFLDIYLGAKCRFFIGSAAGITELPKVFRRPILSVNQLPLEWTHSWGPQDIFIPKKIWIKSEARFLTYLELLTSGIGTSSSGNEYADAGADPIENTPEEITAAVLEMEDRLNSEWCAAPEDEELQNRFWALFDTLQARTNSGDPLHYVIAARIGAEFLRSNPELIEREASWSL